MKCKPLMGLLLLSSAAVVHASPTIVAHRGGTGDAPENTLAAIGKALENKADAIWITVQLSKDGVPVLYRPADLKALTNATGPVSTYTAAQLNKLDAGYSFGKPDFPYRNKGNGIPTLESVLKKWPETFFFIDIKSPDAAADKMAAALEAVLKKTRSLSRTRVYSTDEKYLHALPADIARFASRDATRTTLANITMNHQCSIPVNEKSDRWYGLELKREVDVVEKFTLGEGHSRAILSWDKEAMDCFRAAGGAHIILFGVNMPEDFQKASELGADGVLVDSPAAFKNRQR